MIENPIKVLVVDDDTVLVDLLVDTLDVIGYQTTSATSAFEALKKIEQIKFDMVITDINMPGMSGVELLEVIKEEYDNIPVMLITGVSTDKIEKRAYKSGAAGYLAKPFRITRIETEIDNILHSNAKRKVLLVDDNIELLEVLKKRLELSRCMVYTADSYQSAMELLTNNSFDLVITDLKLPDSNGIQLFTKIKESMPELPVIVISGYATELLKDKMKLSGIASFIPKPLDFDELDTIISKYPVAAH